MQSDNVTKILVLSTSAGPQLVVLARLTPARSPQQNLLASGICPMYPQRHSVVAHHSTARKFCSSTKNKRRATRGRTCSAATVSRLIPQIPCRPHVFYGSLIGTILSCLTCARNSLERLSNSLSRSGMRVRDNASRSSSGRLHTSRATAPGSRLRGHFARPTGRDGEALREGCISRFRVTQRRICSVNSGPDGGSASAGI